jgi:hypothetical protein
MAKHSTPRGLRDEANVGPDPRQARHLVPLKELGRFTVAADDPDIRGWAVYSSTGREVGRVDELLVDTDTNEVVMLDIDLRRDDRHTLAPLRAAWVDHAARRVVIDARELGGDELPSLSRRAALTVEEVARFDEGYGRAYGSYADDRELRVRHADDELRFRRRADDRERMEDRAERTVERGVARESDRPVRGRMVERHHPGEPERYRVADVGERQVRVPRRSDEMVVERRPYVEEVVVRRREASGLEPDAGAADAGTAAEIERRRRGPLNDPLDDTLGRDADRRP